MTGIELIYGKAQYVERLIGLMRKCNEFRIVNRFNVAPYFLYPKSINEFARERAIIKGMRETLTEFDNKSRELFKEYLKAWYSGKSMRYVCCSRGIGFYFGFLEKLFGAEARARAIERVKRELREFKNVEIRVVNGRIPFNVHITRAGIVLAMTTDKNEFICFGSMNEDVLFAFNELFDRLWSSGAKIEGYLKKVKRDAYRDNI